MVRVLAKAATLVGVFVALAVAFSPYGPARAPSAHAQTTAAALPAAARVAVLDARLGLHPDKTRFVLELSEVVPFRVTTQPDPYRVLVDLPALDWPGGAGSMPGKGLVLRYGLGPAASGGVRLVFDTDGPVRVREAFLLPPKDGRRPRLVLDLERTGPAEFYRAYAASVLGMDGPPPAPSAGVPLAPPAPAVAGPATVVPAAAPIHAPIRAPIPPPLPPRPARERPTVVIDPGHGGVDPGAVGHGGVFEKDITLAAARELRRQMEATGRYRVVLTRDTDVFLRLRDRVAVARDAGADLFVSLHADSIGSSAIRGLSVYTLSDKASDREAEMLAAKENRADAIAGLNLAVENDQVASILISLAQRDTMNQSRRFANIALEHLRREVRLLPSRPHRQAGFAVLTAPDVPSLLVEMGYLSSPKDAMLLNTPGYRERLARAMVRSIDAYFKWLASVSRS